MSVRMFDILFLVGYLFLLFFLLVYNIIYNIYTFTSLFYLVQFDLV